MPTHVYISGLAKASRDLLFYIHALSMRLDSNFPRNECMVTLSRVLVYTIISSVNPAPSIVHICMCSYI
jgi:hypothetical protein